MLFNTWAQNGSLSLQIGVAVRLRRLEPVQKCKAAPVETDFGHPADIAEAPIVSALILRDLYLDRDIARSDPRNLRGQETVVRSCGGAEHLAHLAAPPVRTANQTHRRRIACLHHFEVPLRKLDHDKSMRAIGEIKDGLSFGDG